MRFDTGKMSEAIGRQLVGFFNELWGSPEAAATELLADASFTERSQGQLSDEDAALLLRAFIENFDAVAARAGWRSKSLLACGIAAESWIEHLGDLEEEAFALLAVQRLLGATGAIVGIDDVPVISLQAQINSRLDDLGVLEMS